MQNVYMTPLKYKNFAGQERTTKLHFHITPREFADWMIDNPDEADSLSNSFSEVQQGNTETLTAGDATTQQKLAMLRLVRVLAELGYGKPSEDGEIFDKSENKKFKYSAAYDAFRLFLFENPKEFVSFITTLLNEEVINEFSTRMQIGAASAEEQAEQEQPAGQKNYDGMTREELVAAMQARTTQQ